MLDDGIFILQADTLLDNAMALKQLAQTLEHQHIVKSSFLPSVLEREISFPTGLQLDGYGVAIPHTDSEHVLKSQLAIMTLARPVEFIQMATSDTPVSVQLILMLALKDGHSQVEALQQLMALIQNKELIMQIIQLPNTPNGHQRLSQLLRQQGIV